MPRKRSIETIDKEISRLETRENSLLTELESVRAERDKYISERNEMLEQQRRQNTDKIGEAVYAAFGKDISADLFTETLEALCSINGAATVIESAKKKLETNMAAAIVPENNEGNSLKNNSAPLVKKEVLTYKNES